MALQNDKEQLVVDDSRAFEGRHSVHIHTPNSGYERAMLTHTGLFPAPSNTFFGRAYLYFQGTVPQAHFTFLGASGNLPGDSQPTSLTYGGQFGIYLANYYNDMGRDDWQHAGTQQQGAWVDSTAIVANRWVCMEWQFKGDTNEMHLWLDGKEVTSMALVGRSRDCCPERLWTAPPYTAAEVGFAIVSNADPISAYDLWYDAVALDTRRIGCLPAQTP